MQPSGARAICFQASRQHKNNCVRRDAFEFIFSLQPSGARAICGSLGSNIYLTKLNLAWNCIENEGMAAVGEMLGTNEYLVELDLSNTRVTGEGCLVLVDGLRRNKALEVCVGLGRSVVVIRTAHDALGVVMH